MSDEFDSTKGRFIRINGKPQRYLIGDVKDSGPDNVSLHMSGSDDGKEYALPNVPKDSLKNAADAAPEGQDLAMNTDQDPQPVEEKLPGSQETPGGEGENVPQKEGDQAQESPPEEGANTESPAQGSEQTAQPPVTQEDTSKKKPPQDTDKKLSPETQPQKQPAAPLPHSGFQAPPPQTGGKATPARPSPQAPIAPGSSLSPSQGQPLHTQPSPHKFNNLNQWRSGKGQPKGPSLARRRPLQPLKAPESPAPKGKGLLGKLASPFKKKRPAATKSVAQKTAQAAENVAKKAIKFTFKAVIRVIGLIFSIEFIMIAFALIFGCIIVFALASAIMSPLNVFSDSQEQQVNYSSFKSQALQSGISEDDFEKLEAQAQKEFDQSQLKKDLERNQSGQCSGESCTTN